MTPRQPLTDEQRADLDALLANPATQTLPAKFAQGSLLWDYALRSALRERDEARRERDLAIAHDRQPYPTAEAYELACRTRENLRAKLGKAREALKLLLNEPGLELGEAASCAVAVLSEIDGGETTPLRDARCPRCDC
jgi:hypothetical protein